MLLIEEEQHSIKILNIFQSHYELNVENFLLFLLKLVTFLYVTNFSLLAGVAQLVEQLICNQ